MKQTLYTLCLKKIVPTLFFCSVSVKHELIWIKIGRHTQEETLNKTTMQKMPTSSNICVSTTLGNLKWHIELLMQYIHVHFNESLNTIKRLAIIVSEIIKCVVIYVIFTSCARNVCLQKERKHIRRWYYIASRTFNDQLDSDCLLSFDALFQFVVIRDLITHFRQTF